MAVVLPNSIFYHIGRTGGHWVSHVLWQSGLVERRLTPLHITPAQAMSGGRLGDKPFTFCFVRHPLKWLASYWMHEMEFGWSPSETASVAASDRFDEFLTKLLKAWPDEGPCSRAMAPYVDHCSFVGRVESLSDDLGRALALAGETFDPAVLSIPPINETSIARIREAAKAPAELLAEVMKREDEFNVRFQYSGIPEIMVGEAEPVRSILRGKSDGGTLRHINGAALLNPEFDYYFDDGEVIKGTGRHQAAQWAFSQAIEELPPGGDSVVVSEHDPYFAYMAADLGHGPVTYVQAHEHAASPAWRDRLAAEVEYVAYQDFLRGEKPAHDAVVLCDSLEISVAAEVELLHAALVLKPGGVLVFGVPTLTVEAPIKVTWSGDPANRGRKLSYYSLEYVRNLLAPLGFRDLEVVRSMSEAVAGPLEKQVEDLAASFKLDPDRLLGKAIVRARLDPTASEVIDREALLKLWLLRRPAEFVTSPLDGLPKAAQATIAMLRSALAREQFARMAAEQGMADRERELIETRVNMAALANDANYSREQISIARRQSSAAEQQLSTLQGQIELLGLKVLQDETADWPQLPEHDPVVATPAPSQAEPLDETQAQVSEIEE
ncbi:sulfotransferase family 2 domain-containing protein [Caulobacter sp. Root1472]|uniref:sulfotransferase family 2 domain-containing protein n=1 Tax=Caulobacter sp. Root1472 TaxID=1736470 RepID=UPI0006FB3FD2|nr:sulfotransferase family 2 domain-containing protein [Caulobacter sp. Root1472]KQZ29882.1 hypothetical protein ASD47_03645 [Caulobacter sp. Root1472]